MNKELNEREIYEKWLNDNYLVELPPMNPDAVPVSHTWEAFKFAFQAGRQSMHKQVMEVCDELVTIDKPEIKYRLRELGNE